MWRFSRTYKSIEMSTFNRRFHPDGSSHIDTHTQTHWIFDNRFYQRTASQYFQHMLFYLHQKNNVTCGMYSIRHEICCIHDGKTNRFYRVIISLSPMSYLVALRTNRTIIKSVQIQTRQKHLYTQFECWNLSICYFIPLNRSGCANVFSVFLNRFTIYFLHKFVYSINHMLKTE